jgi:hypothetical protein
MQTITISNISGLTQPYEIYVCDVYGNQCSQISTVNTSVPPSITLYNLPPIFNTAPSVGIKIITSDGCERFEVVNCSSL